jgi:Peptidase family M28
MRAAALAILVLGLCGFCAAQKIRFSPANKAEILQRTKNTPQTDQQRTAQLNSWFREAGCGNDLSEQKVSGSDAPNVICRLRGKSDGIIVVGAHYDRANSAERPMDNWTGAALLPGLYQCLHSRRRRHTVIFVAFADNGNQLAGAETYVASLSSAELSHVEAMIILMRWASLPPRYGPRIRIKSWSRLC